LVTERSAAMGHKAPCATRRDTSAHIPIPTSQCGATNDETCHSTKSLRDNLRWCAAYLNRS
jgi:hypothetical protein